MTLATKCLYVMQIYLPTTGYPVIKFRDYVDKIHELCSTFSSDGQVIIMGDFNSAISQSLDEDTVSSVNTSCGTRQRYLSSALRHQYMRAVTLLNICDGPRYTFIPYNDGNPSFIDHICVHESLIPDVIQCNIGDDAPLNISRHFPVFMRLDIGIQTANPDNPDSFAKCAYNWTSCNVREAYRLELSTQLNEANFNYDDVNETYDSVVKCIQRSSEASVPVRKYKPYLKPYWNNEIKMLHKINRQKRQVWIANGRPRNHDAPSYIEYKDAKRIFRQKLRRFSTEWAIKENEKLDTSAEVDQNSFWKLVNAKRTHKSGPPSKGLQFGSTFVKDPVCVIAGWGDYFANIYKFTTHPDFDDDHKRMVDSTVSHLLDKSTTPASHDTCIISHEISEEDLQRAIDSLPFKKAGCLDNIVYEHIKYGGQVMMTTLLKLFNSIIVHESVPLGFKEGLIIPLHKGHKKSLTDPNNYRAISLMPIISKLFEKVIQMRINDSGLVDKIHPLQHGFRRHKNCKMVSLILQESVLYCKERGSVLYACFMDAEKAFDRVWINGLLYKLSKFGINGKDLRLISNIYSDMVSRVFYNGYLSDWVRIQQGTRQGGITSPFFYNVFLNDLLQLLDESGFGLKIGDTNFSAPTQADDIALLSTTKSGIDHMLEICNKFSDKWRFNYNTNKCKVLVFNESKHKFDNNGRQWRYGSDLR